MADTATQRDAIAPASSSPRVELKPLEEEYQHGRQLIDYARWSRPVFGEFSTLQQQNLAYLQNKLAVIKAEISETGRISQDDTEGLVHTMHNYINAIRDLEYMCRLQREPVSYQLQQRLALEMAFPEIAARPGFPYDTTYCTFSNPNERRVDAVRELLRRFLPARLSYSKEEMHRNPYDYMSGKPPEGYSLFLNYLADSIIASTLAISGGASLIVPMVIMALNPSLKKSLITTSVAVVVFSLFLGFWDRKNMLALTFGYAAVLVVFVGTSGTPS